jgi:hypothetical protein
MPPPVIIYNCYHIGITNLERDWSLQRIISFFSKKYSASNKILKLSGVEIKTNFSNSSLKKLNLSQLAMKKSTLILSLFFILLGTATAQENQTWETPMHEVKFKSNGSDKAIMKVDPGYNYADLSVEERNYRILFIYGIGKIKHARIIDQDSKLQIARGKGSYFWGNRDLSLSTERYST